MASTYSTNLAIELIGTGDQAGTWGTTTNSNLGTLIEQSISGYVTQAVSTGTDTTITIPNGTTGVARNMYIELTGTGGTNTNLVVPANKKLYFIFNNSTGAVTVKVSGQTGVSVPTGKKMVLVSNGTDIVNGLNYIADFGTNSFTVTNLTASSGTITNLLATSGSITNLVSSDASATVLRAGSATLTHLSATSATITNLTLTSLVISNLSIASANITTLTSASATITNLLATSLAVSSIATFSAGSAAAPSITTTGDTNTGLFFPAADTIAFTEGGVESMRIDSNANVGINTTSPSAKLDVVAASFNGGPLIGARFNTANFRMGFGIANANGFPFLGVNVNNAANDNGTFDISNWASRLRMDNGIFQFQTSSASGTAGNAITWSTHAYLDTSGNLGLGTTSPNYKLTVQSAIDTYAFNIRDTIGNERVLIGSRATAPIDNITPVQMGNDNTGNLFLSSRTNSASGINFYTNAGTAAALRATIDSSGNLGIGTSSPVGKLQVSSSAPAGLLIGFNSTSFNYYDADNHIFRAGGGTERARITSAGDLLVGTTGADARLTVTGPGNSTPVVSSKGTTSGDTTIQHYQLIKYDNDSTTSQVFVKFYINQGGAACGQINANGASQAAFGSVSDQRLKENIADLPSQLSNIMALRPVKFDYVESYGGGHQIGFVAQEMQLIYPDVVSEDKTSEKIMSITGWSKTEARLVKAIQEQQTLIIALTARIAALESK